MGDRIPRKGPSRNIPEINEPSPSNNKLIKHGESYIEKFTNGINKDADEFNGIYNDISPDIDKLTLEIARIKDLPVSKENYINLADNYKRLFALYGKLPMKEGFINPMKGKNVMLSSDIEDITPKASTSFNIDEIPLIAGFNIPKEPIIPFVSSPQPMSNVELDVSPGKIVNNMTTYQGLTINEMNILFDKFLSIGLNNLDEVKRYISLRIECLDDKHENFSEAYENNKETIKLLQDEIQRLYELDVNPYVLSARKDCLMRFEQVYCQIPHRNNLGLVECLDTYNMSMNPELYDNPDQPIYDIDAMDRYANQLDDNLNQDIDKFLEVKEKYGDELADIYNEIERLNYLPKNSYTNKALYEIYLKLFDILNKYPTIEDIDLIHKSPFIQQKTSELLSVENIPEL